MKDTSVKRLPVKLAVTYLRQHGKQFLAIALVVGMFASTLFAVQLLRSAVEHTLLTMRLDTYSHFSGAAFSVDPALVTPERLAHGHGGLAEVYGSFVIEDAQISVLYGTLDETAISALGLTLREGHFPQAKNEIALSYSTYVALKQYVSIGETISIPIGKDAITGTDYTLCGIFYDGYTQWDTAYEKLDNTDLPEVIVYPNGQTAMYSHIIFDDSYIGKADTTPDDADWCSGKYYVNWGAVHQTSSKEEAERQSIMVLTIVATHSTDDSDILWDSQCSANHAA